MLRAGLETFGLTAGGEHPYAVVRVPDGVAEADARRSLLEQFGVHVTLVATHTWRIGLLGADARPDAAQRVLTALQHVLAEHTRG
ncbi:MAG: hypothetical protein LC797_19720 [Chloroflexi bacterium]|nr:hypothetical protein [Chloroflexota bacterium]